ncbi:glycosyltransferase family A protein [Luteimonas sp. JM171]|uniref:glycosyltransferase family A protein n=1 Tax=Luteimonas sp. JM171 TaxID=1896164 RepID=UPI0012FADEEA|nr:glycosyltransferase family A protein [Luteimonas sp. JM171]
MSKILPQLDHLYVTLNGYAHVPKFLDADKITVLRSQDIGDLRDNAKFLPVFMVEEDFYFVSFDDDLDYAGAHVSHLISGIERYQRMCVVGIHGVIYPESPLGFADRWVKHYTTELSDDIAVSVLGTGTIAAFGPLLRSSLPPLIQTGMADLMLAIGAKKAGVPLICRARKSRWLSDFVNASASGSIYDDTIKDSSAHDNVVRTSAPWGFASIGAAMEKAGCSWSDGTRALSEFGRLLEQGVPLCSISLKWGESLAALALETGWREIVAAAVRSLYRGSEARTVVAKILEGVEDPLLCDAELAKRLLKDHAFEEAAVVAVSTWRKSPSVDVVPTLVRSLISIGLVTQALEVHDEIISVIGEHVYEGVVDVAIASAFYEGGPTLTGPVVAALNSGPRGTSAAAIAAARRDEHWAESAALSAIERGLKGRWEREFFEELRGRPNVVVNPMVWHRVGMTLDPPKRAAVASVLLATENWPQGEGALMLLDSLSAREHSFWYAEAMRQMGHNRAVIDCLNRDLLRHGMLPICDSESNAGNILARLKVVGNGDPGRKISSQPLVTVVMAYFNDSRTFDYAIRSVADQSYGNIEIIVVDDCSDVPVRIPEDVLRKRSVKLIRHDVNSGPYACRNTGLGHSSGVYFTTHDSDDWMHSDHVLRKVARMELQPDVQAVYTRHIRITPKGALAFENNGLVVGDGPMTGMFRTTIFEGLGKFLEVRTRGDVEFKDRLISRFGRGCVHTDEGVSLLSLAWNSNSKRNTADWEKRAALNAFKFRFHREHQFSRFRLGRRMPEGVS